MIPVNEHTVGDVARLTHPGLGSFADELVGVEIGPALV